MDIVQHAVGIAASILYIGSTLTGFAHRFMSARRPDATRKDHHEDDGDDLKRR